MERLAGAAPGASRPSLEELHGTRLSVEQIEERAAALAALPLAERRGVAGLEPERADVIAAGALIQARSLRRLEADEIVVSLRGLRYGLLYELLGYGPG